MGDSGVANGQSGGVVECDCERRCSNPRHGPECRSGAGSPALERRNRSVLGRLRNLAARSTYSTNDDAHSHSSDYEEPEDEKRSEPRFSRDSKERNSSSWAGRVRDLHRDVKKKISRLRNSKGAAQDEEAVDGVDISDVVIQPGSSVESIPSNSGSSLQPPTPTSSNRSSTTSAGEEEQGTFAGAFIGKARALVDCIPSPYDRDGLAFKKGDIIDIIAKHKTGLWVGMANGKVGHFKFICAEEVVEERGRGRRRRRRVTNDLSPVPKKPETLDELLQIVGLQEYVNVLVLNGYDELDTFKEIERADLESLGISDPDHVSKLLRAAEALQDFDIDGHEFLDEEDTHHPKQSPRDSGCYDSHENLHQRESSSTRAMSNGHFTLDHEDNHASQPESPKHLLDSHQLVTMNNLDLSATSSPREGAVDVNDGDNANYNILPSAENVTLTIVGDEPKSQAVFCSELQTASDATSVANSQQTQETLPSRDIPTTDNSYFLPKSSPASPRKTRSKHSRNKSHSHRARDFYSDLAFNGHSKSLMIRQVAPAEGVYVRSWGSLLRVGRRNSNRRNLNEYEDIVSDPATEAEDSPGRNLFRRVKQRKGSLQTLIHDTRPPSPTLLSRVNEKLVAEKIYLHEEPYTDKTGFCGIPPALVQRYAEELQRNITDVADALDQVRITALQQQARRGVPNDFLSDSCIVPVIEPNYSSLRSWLVSLGIPMYESNFTSAGLTELHQVSSLTLDELDHLGIHDSYHHLFLDSALNALYMRYQPRRPQTFSQSQSSA